MNASASVVLYKTEPSDLATVYRDVLASGLGIRLYLVDNSPEPCIEPERFPEATYIFSGSNLGYGTGHNVALARAQASGSEYHFVLNPDVHFGPETLPALLRYAREHGDVGCLMPRVLNADGSPQRICRLLPTPMDLIGRRFLSGLLPRYFERRNERYELAFWGYDTTEEVPIVSGCFLLLRMSAVQEAGPFDERFFMYLEDYDLVRRLGRVSRVVFYAEVETTHAHAKMSYKSLRPTLWHMRSAISYFCKWGWFSDPERKAVNAEALERLRKDPS